MSILGNFPPGSKSELEEGMIGQLVYRDGTKLPLAKVEVIPEKVILTKVLELSSEILSVLASTRVFYVTKKDGYIAMLDYDGNILHSGYLGGTVTACVRRTSGWSVFAVKSGSNYSLKGTTWSIGSGTYKWGIDWTYSGHKAEIIECKGSSRDAMSLDKNGLVALHKSEYVYQSTSNYSTVWAVTHKGCTHIEKSNFCISVGSVIKMLSPKDGSILAEVDTGHTIAQLDRGYFFTEDGIKGTYRTYRTDVFEEQTDDNGNTTKVVVGYKDCSIEFEISGDYYTGATCTLITNGYEFVGYKDGQIAAYRDGVKVWTYSGNPVAPSTIEYSSRTGDFELAVARENFIEFIRIEKNLVKVYSDEFQTPSVEGDVWKKSDIEVSKDGVWTDEVNTFFSREGYKHYVIINGTLKETILSRKNFDGSYEDGIGIKDLTGKYVWTDGKEIYFSFGTKQYHYKRYEYDSGKATAMIDTWVDKAWSGLTNFNGNNVWRYNGKTYYSDGDAQYVLDNSTWSAHTWKGLTNFVGAKIWKNGDVAYYSDGDKQYVLSANNMWIPKMWNVSNIDGSCIWKRERDIYYSKGTEQYVLFYDDWKKKSWGGLTEFNGCDIWTDGVNNYTGAYILNKAEDIATAVKWDGEVVDSSFDVTFGGVATKAYLVSNKIFTQKQLNNLLYKTSDENIYNRGSLESNAGSATVPKELKSGLAYNMTIFSGKAGKYSSVSFDGITQTFTLPVSGTYIIDTRNDAVNFYVNEAFFYRQPCKEEWGIKV